jgi:hypothetical protein
MDNRGREGEIRRKEEQILNYKTRRYSRIPSNTWELRKKVLSNVLLYILSDKGVKTRKLAVI